MGGALFKAVVSPMLLGVVRYGVIAAVEAATLPVPELPALVGVVALAAGCDVPVEFELHAASRLVARSSIVAAPLRLMPTCIPPVPVRESPRYAQLLSIDFS